MMDGNLGECGLYEVSVKKKKRKEKGGREISRAAADCEDTWLQPWNCLLLCNTATSQWAGNAAKMKSVFVSAAASMGHCPLAVNELTLYLSQN